MSIEDDEENSLDAYFKTKKNSNLDLSTMNEDETEEDKKEEEEIIQRYEKIGNLTDIESIKESKLSKSYDDQDNKYYNEYKFIKVLGQGAYSKVKLVEKDKIKYAMKIIDKKLLKSKKIFKQDKDGNIIVSNLLKDALKEIAILKKLDHPNIIKLFEILHDYQKQKIYLILEYADYGDIINYDEDNEIFSINNHVKELYKKLDLKYNMGKSVEDKKYYEEKDINDFAKNILLGLDYLHKNGIIHHDIKPNNILLCKNKICKITDFNFSSILENLNEDNIGSNGESADNFRAPETLHLDDEDTGEQNYQGKPLDIWAFGITLYILTYLKFPFDSDKGILGLYEAIKNNKVKFPLEPHFSRKIKFLIEQCLAKQPEKRKTADQLLKILIRHKKETTDKYKAIFRPRTFSVELPINELAQGLDFFAEHCSAVFENPNDKNKPFIIKLEKKLKEFLIPEDRITPEVFKKRKSVKKSKNNSIENNIIIEKKESAVKEEESFFKVLSKKVGEVIVTTKTVIETTFLNKNGDEVEENKKEGKYALQEIIKEK